MTSYGDDLGSSSTYGDGGALLREPGADHLVTDCCPPGRRVPDVLLIGLDQAGADELQAGLKAACLQRCEAWPQRRRELWSPP